MRVGDAEKTLVSHVVVVTDFEWTYKHGHGQDRFFTMTLREWFPQKLLVVGAKKRRSSNGGKKGGGSSKPLKGTKYIVKQGDCLWKISDKFLGDGRLWKKIYALNKIRLNQELKKRGQRLNNPHLIYAGTPLVIPPKSKKG